jgi:periplasmic divalent cation tolerance protein
MVQAADMILVFVMAANEKEACGIAQALVSEQLAACVNLVTKVRSIYKWQGKIEHSRECLMLIKTSARKYVKLEGRVKQLHCYEVPEIIAAPLTSGSADYLKWISESITSLPARSIKRKSSRPPAKSLPE